MYVAYFSRVRGRFPSAVFGGGVVYVCFGHIFGGFGLFLFAIFISEFTPCSIICLLVSPVLRFKRSTDVSFIMMLGLENPTSPVGLPDNNSDCVEMSNDVEENNESQILPLQVVNNNYVRSAVTVAELLQQAASNGGKNFNMFLNSTVSKVIPRKDPRAIQAEIKNKIAHASKIENVDILEQGAGFSAPRMLTVQSISAALLNFLV